MALKITKQIGTSKGITNGAYVRISNYLISKLGYLQLNIQLFQNESDALNISLSSTITNEVINSEIGNSLMIPLVKKDKKIVKKIVSVDEIITIKVPIYDENGKFTGELKDEESTQMMPKEIETEEEYSIPDLSLIEGKDIFAFGYEHLKSKLSEIFGAENVVDC